MSAVSVTVSAAAVVVSATVGLSSALRAQYDRVLNVLDYISGDQVAQARHQLGMIIHSGQMPKTAHDTNRRVADLFVVLWAFQRVNAVRRSLPRKLPWLHGPHTLLRTNVRPWVEYWTRRVDNTAKHLNAEIGGSRDGLDELARQWEVAPPRL